MTLARLQSRQNEIDHATDVLEELEAESNPSNITKKMADAGFGAPTQKRAQDVLERLKAKNTPPSKPKQKSSRPDAA